MKKIPLRTKITLKIAGLGQSRPGFDRNNENTIKTKSQISGYILRNAAAILLFSCVIVALSSAINAPNKPPKFPAPQNNAAFGVNGRGSPSVWGGNHHAYANDNCTPNDYTITSGSGIIVHGTTDTGNHCDDCI